MAHHVANFSCKGSIGRLLKSCIHLELTDNSVSDGRALKNSKGKAAQYSPSPRSAEYCQPLEYPGGRLTLLSGAQAVVLNLTFCRVSFSNLELPSAEISFTMIFCQSEPPLYSGGQSQIGSHEYPPISQDIAWSCPWEQSPSP